MIWQNTRERLDTIQILDSRRIILDREMILSWKSTSAVGGGVDVQSPILHRLITSSIVLLSIEPVLWAENIIALIVEGTFCH